VNYIGQNNFNGLKWRRRGEPITTFKTILPAGSGRNFFIRIRVLVFASGCPHPATGIIFDGFFSGILPVISSYSYYISGIFYLFYELFYPEALFSSFFLGEDFCKYLTYEKLNNVL